jgi:hypothetical protein
MKFCILAFLIPVIGFSATETVALESSRDIKVVITTEKNQITAKVSFFGVRSLGKETNDLVNSESSTLYAVQGLSKALSIPSTKEIEIQGLNLVDFSSDSNGRIKATLKISSYKVVDSVERKVAVSKNPENQGNQAKCILTKEATLLSALSDWKQITDTVFGAYTNKLEKIGDSKKTEEIDLSGQIFDNADQAEAAFKGIESEIMNDRFLLTNEREQLLEMIKNKKSEIISLSKNKINDLKVEEL